MVKRAFLKTVEMLLAVIVTALFLVAVIPTQPSTPVIERDPILKHLESDQDFRTFLQNSSQCYNQTKSSDTYIRQYLPSRFTYILCAGPTVSDLPLTSVTVDSMFFAGNLTTLQYKTIRLYYWT